MANNRREEMAPNIYPLGHPLRNAKRTQNVPTPQPARSRPAILDAVPTAPAAVPTPAVVPQAAAPAPAAPATTDGATTAAVTATENTDAKTTEV